MKTINPNCDGDHCENVNGQVRKLPTGSGGNAILCRACHQHEIRWRNDRNKDLSPDAQFDLPAWDTLQLYGID